MATLLLTAALPKPNQKTVHFILLAIEANHCMKSVQIRSFFWSVFSHIWTEYGEIWSIQSERGKIRTKKISVFCHFSRSVSDVKSASSIKVCWHLLKKHKNADGNLGLILRKYCTFFI